MAWKKVNREWGGASDKIDASFAEEPKKAEEASKKGTCIPLGGIACDNFGFFFAWHKVKRPRPKAKESDPFRFQEIDRARAIHGRGEGGGNKQRASPTIAPFPHGLKPGNRKRRAWRAGDDGTRADGSPGVGRRHRSVLLKVRPRPGGGSQRTSGVRREQEIAKRTMAPLSAAPETSRLAARDRAKRAKIVAWYNARNKAGGGGGGGGGIGPSASNLSEATDATDDAAEDRDDNVGGAAIDEAGEDGRVVQRLGEDGRVVQRSAEAEEEGAGSVRAQATSPRRRTRRTTPEDRDDNVGGAAIDDDDAENRSLASNASSASKANASKANASPALKKGSRQPLVPLRTLGRAAVPGPPPSPSRAPLAVQKKVEEKAEKEAEPPAVPSSPSITSLSGGSAKERAMAFSNARKSLAASRTAAAAVAATGAPVAAPPSPAEREIREKAAEVAAWAESKGPKLGARPKGGTIIVRE